MNYLRIKKNADFQKLFNRGKRVFSPTLTLIYFPSNEPRMGVAVSKKHGKAVKRNRVKRLVREAFRQNVTLFERNYSVVILPKAAESYALKDFDKSLKICIKKVNACESASAKSSNRS